ncbi:hypothetical protein KY366_02015 [Candidatus Woesearchaeota archaeon]|nr:hypothetical protein [Candidatus Woesearchaeota archaeon]
MKNKKRINSRIRGMIKRSPFIGSFKAGNRFWKVLALDILFIILLISLIPLYALILRSNLDVMKTLDSSSKRIEETIQGEREMDPMLLDDMVSVSSAIRLFMLKTAIISAFFIAAIILLTGFIKSKAWLIIIKDGFNKATAWRFSLMVFVWNLLWAALFLFSIFALRFELDTIKAIAVVEFFVYVYFSLIMAPIFFRSKKIGRCLKETFSIGAVKFHAFLPAVLAIWVISSLLFLSGLSITAISPKISILTLGLLALFYLTWIKFYVNATVKNIYC